MHTVHDNTHKNEESVEELSLFCRGIQVSQDICYLSLFNRAAIIFVLICIIDKSIEYILN